LSLIAFAAPLLFILSLQASTDKPNFIIDAANFSSHNPKLSRLDLFIKVLFNDVQFIKSADDWFLAEYEISFEVFNDKGESIDSKALQETILVDDVGEIKSKNRFKLSKASFDLRPGKYKVLIALKDLETREKRAKTVSLELKDFLQPNNLASDILILDDYYKDESGRVVFYPRVSHEKREGSKLFAYFEVYDIAENDSFEVSYAVLDSDREPLWSNAFIRKGAGRVTQNFIVIEGDSLQHGTYLLKLRIKHADNSLEVERAFDWFIEGIPPSISSLDEAIEVLKYTTTTEEEYKRLMALDGKEKFSEFVKFWKKRDPTPDTPENERRTRYYQRVEYANRHFGKLGKNGWKTEMGWAYVLLGAPDTIERNPYTIGIRNDGRTVKAIQIWVYFRHNKQLVFYDANGYGDYRLHNPDDLYDMLKFLR
jgi:GWxTD domain-containing protein